VEYRNTNPDHVQWSKALKELYVPNLRDYVKKNNPLGPVWGPADSGAAPKAPAPAPATLPATTASAPKAPAPPPLPAKSLFEGETSTTSSKPKAGISAVFQEINSGKPVSSGKYLDFCCFLLVNKLTL
jgi:adenylyl cyclase-associated protein